MLTFLLDSPREYLLAVILLCTACSVLFVAFCLCIFAWENREPKVRRPRQPLERIKVPREEPIDLAKERYDFEARRDAYAEDHILRRVG